MHPTTKRVKSSSSSSQQQQQQQLKRPILPSSPADLADLSDPKRRRNESLPRLLTSSSPPPPPNTGVAARIDLDLAYEACAYLEESASLELLCRFARLAASGAAHIRPAVDHLLRNLPLQSIPEQPASMLDLALAFYLLIKSSSGPSHIRRDWSDLIQLWKSCKSSAKNNSSAFWFASTACAAVFGLDDVGTQRLFGGPEATSSPPPPSPDLVKLETLSLSPPTFVHLTEYVVDVFGVLMTPGPVPRHVMPMVPTQTFQQNIRLLALALEHNSCVTIKGLSGSGKTSTIKVTPSPPLTFHCFQPFLTPKFCNIT